MTAVPFLMTLAEFGDGAGDTHRELAPFRDGSGADSAGGRHVDEGGAICIADRNAPTARSRSPFAARILPS